MTPASTLRIDNVGKLQYPGILQPPWFSNGLEEPKQEVCLTKGCVKAAANLINSMDEAVKEEMKKEKRRLQEQLRRLKRNQEKEKAGLAKPLTKKQLAARERLRQKQENLRMKCGACGETGHMRTNRCCPKFVEGEDGIGLDEADRVALGPMDVAMTEAEREEREAAIDESTMAEGGESIARVEGTKLTVSTNVVKHLEEVKREAMKLKLSKKQVPSLTQS